MNELRLSSSACPPSRWGRRSRWCSWVIRGFLFLLFFGLAEGVRPAAAEVPPSPETAQRATLLAAGLSPAPRLARGQKVVQVLDLVLGGLELGTGAVWLGVEDSAKMRPMAAAFTGLGAATFGGGLLSYQVPDDDALAVLDVTTDLSTAGLFLALGFGARNTDTPVFPSTVGFILAAGQGGRAALRVVDLAVKRPIAPARLAAHYERLRDPKRRAALTADELASIEADFERSASWMNPYVLHSPAIAAGATGVAYSLATSGLTDRERALGTGLSLAQVILPLALAELESHSGWRGYLEQLEQTGLSLSPGPMSSWGLSVSGRF